MNQIAATFRLLAEHFERTGHTYLAGELSKVADDISLPEAAVTPDPPVPPAPLAPEATDEAPAPSDQ